MGKRLAGSGKLVVTPRQLYKNLSTGDTEYHDAKTMPLVEFDMWNYTREKIEVTLTTTIAYYASPTFDTATLEPGQHKICRQIPQLLREKISALNEDTTVSVILDVNYYQGGIQHHYPTHPLTVILRSYNTILWAIPDPGKPDAHKFLLEHIIAWITRRDPLVQQVLGSLPSDLYRGYPKSYRPAIPEKQVEAIFNSLLAADKVKYGAISDVKRFEEKELCQYVWRPHDGLTSGSSNCIDGAVLYAALIEAIGLDPVIVIKEQHAFVGWKTCRSELWNALLPEDGDEQYGFLETTWTQGHTFEEARKQGEKLYKQILDKKWLGRDPFSDGGFAVILDIVEKRDELEVRKRHIDFSIIQDIAPAPPETENKAPVNILDRMPGGVTQGQAQEAESDGLQPPAYLLVARDYINDIQQRLRRIEPAISSNMQVADCTFVINTLNVIPAPLDLPGPAGDSLAAGSRLAWENNLDALKREVDVFNDRTAALRETLRAKARTNGATSSGPAGTWTNPALYNIPTLFMNLSNSTQTLAGKVKAAMRTKKRVRKKAEAH